MLEMMFGGAGSPMWTTMPAMTLPYQPVNLGARSMNPPALGSPTIGGMGIGPLSTPAMATPGALATGMFGYGGAGLGPSASPVTGPGVAVAYPFGLNPWTAQADIATAQGILAAVALRRGQPQGPTNDAEVEEFIYDALDLLPGAADVEVRSENGRVTLTGSVQHKRTKRDAGEIAWAMPGLQDVQNNVSITSRRRSRAAGREPEAPATVSPRKQA
jgi:hypothetical protein